MTINANITLKLTVEDSKPEYVALRELYDFLYDSLCNAADHSCDFWIESTSLEA